MGPRFSPSFCLGHKARKKTRYGPRPRLNIRGMYDKIYMYSMSSVQCVHLGKGKNK